MRFKQFFYSGVIFILLLGCAQSNRNSETIIPKISNVLEFGENNEVEEVSVAGHYISVISLENKFQRKIISVSFVCTERILIKAHFYKDKKITECEFQKIFFKKNSSRYLSKVKDKTIFIDFTRDDLSIRLGKLKKSEILAATCPPNYTLEGIYKKIKKSPNHR